MPTNAEIAKFEDFGLNDEQSVSYRPRRVIEIVEPNPKWPSLFILIAQRIQAALGGRALAIEHIGSTSVPGLPAKDVIDINLVVADPTAEGDYVRDLEDAGFQFLSRMKVICFSFSTGFFQSSSTLTRDAVGASLLWPRRAVRQHPCMGPRQLRDCPSSHIQRVAVESRG